MNNPTSNGIASPFRTPYWSKPIADLMAELHAAETGLTTQEAQARLGIAGRNTLSMEARATPLRLFLSQFRSPLVLILIFAAIVSAVVGEGHEAIIIATIVLASCTLSFSQEFSASKAMETLKQRITARATVSRDGAEVSLATEEIVPGDIVKLSAGSLIPADAMVSFWIHAISMSAKRP